MICTFIGHSDFKLNDTTYPRLHSAIMDVIAEGVDTFYCGFYGLFDMAVVEVLKEIQQQLPHITICGITPYSRGITKRFIMECADKCIYPLSSKTNYRQAIVERNQWMICECSHLICYVKKHNSNSHKILVLAHALKKNIFNIASAEIYC